MSSQYTVSNGQIHAPDGSAFVARGVDVLYGRDVVPSATTLLGDFPGMNFVRLAIYNYESPQELSAYVNDLTSHGLVVELEDHTSSDNQDRGGGQGQIFSGDRLTQELNWYSSVASAFKGNANVWFGTNNEPSVIDSSGNTNIDALSDWQKATYDTIRATGNTNPVMLEAIGGWTPQSVNAGMKQSDYSGMTNTIWDMHYYGWETNYSTDQATDNKYLADTAAAAQLVTSANGVMPVIIGEYGNSTTGADIDPNGTQVVNAVQNSGMGNVAWAWSTGNPGDGLLSDNNGTLSSYGRQVAAGIAANAKNAPTGQTAVPTPPAGPSAPASANDSVLAAGAAGSLTDGQGNAFTISNGAVQINGAAAGYSANVAQIAYVDGMIYQENASGLWWGWNGQNWGTGDGTATSPVPASVVTPPPVTPTPTPAADPNIVLAGSAQAITDGTGNQWTITANGTAQVNGSAAGYSANVVELANVGGTVYQENADNLWWAWNGTDWGTGSGSATSPVPVTSTTPPPSPTPTVTPDTISVMASGVVQTATAPGTVAGDTFSLTDTGITTAALGSTPTFVQFTGNAGVAVTGGTSGSIVTATDGANAFLAGSGPMSISGGAGANSYVFGDNASFMAIQDFSAAKGDTLSIAGDLQASMQTAAFGNGTTLMFGNGSMIDLPGLSAAPAIHWMG